MAKVTTYAAPIIMLWYAFIPHPIGFTIISPSTTTVVPGPSPGPTLATLS